jgi:hypothetical protein
LIISALLMAAPHAEAQVNVPASPFVSPGHWSYSVLRRLDHAGRLPRGADVARQSMPQEEIASLLTHANATAYLARFRKEFKAPGAGFSMLGAATTVGYLSAHGNVAPGIGYDTANWSGARPLGDDDDVFANTRVGVAYAGWSGGALQQGKDGLDEAQLVLAKGYLGGWIGRRRLGYAMGDGGGLVVNNHRFDGAGVFLPKPLRLPLLGPVRFEMHAARIDNVLNRDGVEQDTEPWFWTARGSFEPVTGVRFGLNRGMMFGGAGNLPVTFERVAENIIGIYTAGADDEDSFANQILSIDLRVRIPGLPLTAYIDWGGDDGAGAWWDVPARQAGIELVHFGEAFDAAIGIEHLQFSATCCSNSIWYRNAWFRGSWADGDDALGHDLGGHGREWRVFANGGVSTRLVGNVALFQRDRGNENLYAPERSGTATGAEAGINLVASGNLDVILNGVFEKGDGWDNRRLTGALKYRF